MPTMKRLLLLAAAAATYAVSPSTAGAQAPTWQIDATHSELSFRIRHYLTRVRGTFGKWNGTVTADPKSLNQGSVAVSIDARSIDTNDERRDNHLRSPDFFATDSFPTMAFTSSRVEVKGESIKVYGDLTMRGITKPVVLEGTYNGVAKDAQGKERIGFEASAKINRLDHKVTWNRALEGGGAMLGDEVEISIQIEAVRQ
jgi:polyisoprenoid-binding protein YceI